MTTLRKLLLTFAAAAALGSLALAVDSTAPDNPAADPGDDANRRVERLMRFAADRLGLTDAQVLALKEVFRLHQPELQPLRERARAEREELRALVLADTLDEAALEAQAARIAETTRALTIAGAHLRADLRAVLTPEQIDALLQARHRANERRQRGREAFDAWLNAP